MALTKFIIHNVNFVFTGVKGKKRARAYVQIEERTPYQLQDKH